MNKHLHIISFDIPFPPTYGGVIDVFYKLKALHNAGLKITLHCFKYGNRDLNMELEKYCDKVYYYHRHVLKSLTDFKLPYIVATRNHIDLLKNLSLTSSPILFEGIHTCYYLNHPTLKQRKKMVRIHNVEHDYYNVLASQTKNALKKSFFKHESFLLKHYESVLQNASLLLTLNDADTNYYKRKFGQCNTKYLQAFHGYTAVKSMIGQGSYCLYHGNLSVPENVKAVEYLITKVWRNLNVPTIIAGSNPAKKVKLLANKFNFQLIENPSLSEMENIIRQAQCIVIPTFQETGIKLKLLDSLFNGRHVIVNPSMLHGTNLHTFCTVSDSVGSFQQSILKLMQVPFTKVDIERREELMRTQFSNSVQVILDEL